MIDPAVVSKAAGGPVNSESQAKAIGKKLAASYVMFGDYSLTGDTISIQARLADVSGAKKTVSLLAEQQGVENLATAVEQIVDQTSADVLGKAVIAQVRFEGNVRIESAALEAVVKSKKGQLLNPRQVSEDIRAIFKMGYFEKVDADVKSTPAGKILTFVVKENPVINKLVIKGNKKVKTKDILAAITTKQYSVLKRSDLAGDVQKIRKLYQQKAYYNVEITTDITFPISKREAVVTFNIVEHKKVYIKLSKNLNLY
ncbi:MAG: POTRA domain-containing protein [Syntrophobacteraceae bacterium]